MELAETGESNLIDQLAKIVHEGRRPSAVSWQNLSIGIGDDAAVWKSTGDQTLATTDCLIEGIHFTRDITDWYNLGWKALAVNLSDIAAMGGLPTYALITLGLPKDVHTEHIIHLYAGMNELAGKYEVAIAGGNVSSSPSVFISITVIGRADGHLLTRNAAIPGEVVAVTGSLGSAAGGLMLLQKNCSPPESGKILCEAFLKPCPRMEMGALLVAEGVRCATDVSDGLTIDLEHICRQSGVGATIETARVPQLPALTALFDTRATALALSGGEDYEILFTASAKAIEGIVAKAPCPVTVIGTVTASDHGKPKLLGPDGQDFVLGSQGWQHFAD